MLPAGVDLIPLTPHADERGVFTELYRASWEVGVAPVQWNAVFSSANVLRGVHVHLRHADYLTLAVGHATIGLYDLREGSVTEGLAATVELDTEAPAALVIPVGVAHGFYFRERAVHVYSMSHEFDPTEDLGCRWDDPELGIAWPCSDPVISPRDAALGSLSELRAVWNSAFVRA